ncbi:helix-turn-helix domain-containing protein [Streptomyces hygroscopicus]|uniref:helix-turn-helix domain-containing protein n=1 Tax=Streptomyces hygroscopicus TaxID=1912 RepID=UPI0007676C6C
MGNAREIEDFAERLRALKERSGRSYGSLATRLHVSTSTVHRYCNGDAVPADYAPVERFARLCGATPEELVALHRRWMLADASRRRPRRDDREGTSSAPRGGEADTARPVSGSEGAKGRPAVDGTARKAEVESADARDPDAWDPDAQSTDPRPTDTRSTDVQSTDSRPTDARPTDARPADVRSADGEPRRSADAREGADGQSNASDQPASLDPPDLLNPLAPSGPSGPSDSSAPSNPPDPSDPSNASETDATPNARPATADRPQRRDATSGRGPGAAPPPDEATEVITPAPARTAATRPPAHEADTTTANTPTPTTTPTTTTDTTTAKTANAATTNTPTIDTPTIDTPTIDITTANATPDAPTPGPTAHTTPRNGAGPHRGDADAAEPTVGGRARSASAGRTRPPHAVGEPSGSTAGSAPAGRRRLRAVPGSGGESAVVSRVRRPWALLAGAAAVVVLAVTAVEVRPPGEDGRKETAASPPTAAAPSPAPPAGPTARGHLDRQQTDRDEASATPRTDGKGRDDEPRKAGGGAVGSASPRTTEEPADGGSTRAPLTLSTRSHVWENGCDHRYLIDRPPSQVAPPPTEQDAPTWAAAHGAVHGGTTNVEVTVQGRASSAVVLRALHVRVVGRRTPLAWSSFAMENGCGGSLTPRAFSVNLDASRPLARPTDGNDGGEPIPAVRFPYRVAASDPEVLLVNARTTGCDCSWYLELDWTSGGRSGTLRIDDHGSPFRTSSVKGRPEYGYDYTDGTWHEKG